MIKMKQLSPLGAAMALAISLAGCGGDDASQTNQQGGQLLPVRYEALKTQDVPVTITLTGRTSAFRESEVRPQVNGIILKRLFTEGSEVKQGQQLYQIDPAIYEANLAAAKAELARALASESALKMRAQRYAELIKTKAVSQQEFDDADANAKAATAQVMAAKASVKSAEVNLAYTKVYAPITGIIGKSNVTEGALVTMNQSTPLATIHQLDPIYLDVGESVDDLLKTRKDIESGAIKLEDNKIKVSLVFENGEQYSDSGLLEFTGVQVDPTTNMVNVRATVPNKKRILLPGMFMRAVMPKGVEKNAVLVPQVAVIRVNRNDKFVYVIDDKDTVQQKFIELGTEIPGYFVVRSGLSAGERVVVANIQKIKPGMPVKPVDADAAKQQEQKQAEQPQQQKAE